MEREGATAPAQFAPYGSTWRVADATLVQWSPVRTIVTRLWPLPRCWRIDRGPKERWRECFGEVPIGLLRGCFRPRGRQDLALVPAWDTVPTDVRAALAAHGMDLDDRETWRLFTILARCPGARKLAEDVPVLLAALAAADSLRRPPPAPPCSMFSERRPTRPLRSIRALLAGPDGMRRWRRIARWLDLPDARAFIEVLRRVPPGCSLPWRTLRDLRDLWACPRARKALMHLRTPTASTIRVVEAAWRHDALSTLAPALLDAASAPVAGPDLAERYVSTLSRWRSVHPTGAPRGWDSLERLEAARRSIERAEEARQRRRSIERSAAFALRDFPPPPLPGDAVVQPLDSAAALAAEGQEMRHCIGSWTEQAFGLRGYGYRVICPEGRATLWVRPLRSVPLECEITMVRAAANAPPSGATWEAIARWWHGLIEAGAEIPAAWRTAMDARPDGTDGTDGSLLPLEVPVYAAEEEIPF